MRVRGDHLIWSKKINYSKSELIVGLGTISLTSFSLKDILFPLQFNIGDIIDNTLVRHCSEKLPSRIEKSSSNSPRDMTFG